MIKKWWIIFYDASDETKNDRNFHRFDVPYDVMEVQRIRKPTRLAKSYCADNQTFDIKLAGNHGTSEYSGGIPQQ